MKRICILLLALAALASGCQILEPAPSPEPESPSVALFSAAQEYKDGGFLEECWAGISEYCTENELEADYISLSQDQEEALAACRESIENGLQTVVFDSLLGPELVASLQQEYPSLKILLVDSTPQSDGKTVAPARNTLCLTYDEVQAGFLAGYASVQDGFRALGFVGGMDIPSVRRFGIGFLQGAEAAAREMKLEKGEVTVDYTYIDTFTASEEIEQFAVKLFQQENIEVVFAAAGGAGLSVMRAAELNTGKWVIGVDTDQYALSTSVVCSAVKDLKNTVYSALSQLDQGEGGKILHYSLGENGVSLAMENARWATFNCDMYEQLCQNVLAGRYSLASDSAVPETLALEYVTLEITQQ